MDMAIGKDFDQCCAVEPPALRERASSIIRIVAELEALLAVMIGPGPDCESVPTRGEGSLFCLESDLNLIFDRLDRVRRDVGKISEMI
jgi:hypothetical protein